MQDRKKSHLGNAGIAWLSSLAMAAVLSACGGGGGDNPAGPGSQTQAFAAAGSSACSYSHVFVTVQAVQAVQVVDGVQQLVDVPIPAPTRIDLLDLGGGGVLQALAAAPLAPGHYLGLRLVLSSGSDPLANAVQSGTTDPVALAVPNGAENGLKLNADFTLRAGQSVDLIPQGFDPCSAIVSAGGSGQLNLKPGVTVDAKVVVGPEIRRSFSGPVMPLLGGGFVTVANDFNAGTWALQRYDAEGQPTGPATSIALAAAAGHVTNIAPLTGGGYAIVWVVNIGSWQGSDGVTHNVNQIYSQSFTAAGAAIDNPLPLAIVDPGALSRPAAVPQVAELANGGFVIVWGLERSFGSDTFDTSVYSQRFTAAGAPDGTAKQQVTPLGTGNLGLTGLVTGGYMVTWGDLSGADGGARAFGADGLPLGPQTDAGTSWDPHIGIGFARNLQPLANGGAVMSWAFFGQHLMVQQLGPDGTPLAARVVDDASSPGFITAVSLAGLPDGGYVVTWAPLGGNVFARRYAADGTPVGEQTRINLITTNVGSPSVVALPDGSFTISWSGRGTDGVQATYGRTFPANGLIATP
jgi:hypothetical protein